MKIFNTLYKDYASLSAWIDSLGLNSLKNCMVSIHASSLIDTECVELAQYIKKILPYAVVNGCSTSGVIYNGDIFDADTLISIREFDHGIAYYHIESILNKTAKEVADSIAHHSKSFATNFATLYFDIRRFDIRDITDNLNKLLPDSSFIGGIAGYFDAKGEIQSFLFDEKGSYTNAYLVNFVTSDYVLSYTDIITGQPAISDAFTITKAHDFYLDEIDNTPAVKWFREKLGIDNFTENNDWYNTVATDIFLKFPLVIGDYSHTTRFYQYEKDNDAISFYFAQPRVGEKFRIGYSSPLKSAEELQETCYNLQMISAEMIFCYSCVFRKMYSNSIANWELQAFKNSNICGAFMFGEIGTKENIVQHLNGSATFFTLAEKANLIDIDLSVFDSIDSLVEANNELIDTIKKAGERLESDILTSFIQHEEKVKGRFAHTKEGDFESIPQFLKKQNENPQEQICLVSIDGYENHLLYLGEEEFDKLAKENRESILRFIKKQYPFYHFNYYRYDSAHFFFTVEENISDSIFTSIIRNILSATSNSYYAKQATAYQNNFTFTLDGLAIQQLLDASKEKDITPEDKRFNHCDDKSLASNSLNEEFQMVAALQSIIKENAIVPYFQGIYDNKKNFFFMFEALMRLQHPDGRMLFPNDFMDIAKKYNLYLELSLCMVTKVFELFKDRDEVITLNISAYDILSEKFRQTVIEYLKILPNPQNFVFELLETEAFTDLETLRNFIYQVKQFGCKIAVDDFGAGYSNFIEFGNLEVDFLKINGSLTKLLGTDFSYSHILNSIAFMGEKMHVKLIAEFVETAATQKLLIQSGVHYSQGYLFSKPMPFSELKVISKENKAKNKNILQEESKKKNSKHSQTRIEFENISLYVGGFIVALVTLLSVIFYVRENNDEFKMINDSFLVEIATGLSDKVSLFAEESKISLDIMQAAFVANRKNFESLDRCKKLLDELDKATEFSETFLAFEDGTTMDSKGNTLNIPFDEIYGKTYGDEVSMLPIMVNNKGEKVLVFSSNMFIADKKVGEIYGIYKVSELSKLLALKSFGGEAFYHINQVDGTAIYLSGRTENAYKGGDMYEFIGSLDIFNGHTAQSIKADMIAGKTVLINYRLDGEERSAVMVRVPDTDWCIVSIVLAEINTHMIRNNNRNTTIFIAFITLLYLAYFIMINLIFRRHRNVILETLEASQSLSSSLQLSIEKDSLTGTYSRATAIEKISTIISEQYQEKTMHALAILDIDNFKYINDTYGHHTGDMYLQAFVSAVKLAIKPGNILGRLGGDEFLLLLNDVKNAEEVQATFDKIFANIRSISLGGVDLSIVSVSAGIVLISGNEKKYEELMIEADSTLYEAKRKGKNKYLFVE